jgi:hypothetical protein
MASRNVGRGFERNLDAGPLQPMIGSFELHLRAEKKSPKTIRTYIEAAQWLAAEYLIPNEIKFWADVKTRVHSQGLSRLDAGAGGCLSFSAC